MNNRLQFVLTLLSMGICTNSAVPTPDIIEVRNLMGEPDYRKVTLHWEAYTRSGRALPHFQVRYCELQSWGTQRCRTHDVSEPTTNELFPDNSKTYSADVDGLRMATTYSFQVRPALAVQGREDRSDNTIVIPTKGFSARATQCLPHASEIEVSTGPHFGGRITVEAADGDRCTVDGEPESSRDTYVLHIDHKVCGSQVNETTVATYVIVQENLPILTHSTRRFLVLCSYQPETLTVRAGLSLPNTRGHGHGQAAAIPTTNDQQNSNSVRRSRQLRPARLEAANTNSSQNEQKEPASTALIMSVLTLFAVCCIAMVSVSRLRTRRAVLQADTMSIGSDISIATDTSENHTSSVEHLASSTHLEEPATKPVEARC